MRDGCGRGLGTGHRGGFMLDGCGEEARAWGEGLCVGMELGGGWEASWLLRFGG